MYNARGQIYYEHHDYFKSDADYQKIISLEQGNTLGYLGIGRNLTAQKKYAEALSKYNDAIKLDQNNAQAYALRAENYLGLKKYIEASDDIVTSLGLDNGDHAFSLLSNAGKDAKESTGSEVEGKVRLGRSPSG
jgi:tetratricopeptide (TPR) repeat protein